jgi:thiamine biosynthesis lipoprotein
MQLIIRVYKKLPCMASRFMFFFFLTLLGCSPKHELVVHRGYALGTSYSIQYEALSADYETAQKGIDSVFYAVNQSLSTYLPASDISKINEGDSLLVIDHHFLKVFEKADELYRITQGYFDPTVGAWVNAYGFGPDQKIQNLSSRVRDSLKEITSWSKITLTSSGTIKKSHPSIYLDFNAIAKGYAVDVIGDFLTGLGSKNHLVEIGGELVAKGQNIKSGFPWRVGIDRPIEKEERVIQNIVELQDYALATSGNYRKFRVDKETGEKYVHSINPLNGEPVRSNVLSVSVKAPNCMTADAFATALMVMPFEQSKKLIEQDPSLSAYWILTGPKGLEEVFSSNW